MSGRIAFAILAALFILGCALASRPAHAAAVVCGPWKDMREAVARKYGERLIGMGAATSGKSRLEVFASPDGKTFSVFAIYPEGVACLIGAGIDWETLPPPSPRKGRERES